MTVYVYDADLDEVVDKSRREELREAAGLDRTSQGQRASYNAFAREDVHFTGIQMPPWLGKGTEHEPRSGYDSDGMPRFASRREAVEFGKAHGYEYGAR